MTDTSTDVQVWFLRHGWTAFDYDTNEYDVFMDMLCNGREIPLREEHGINFGSLPEQVELVAYSPARRTTDTAELLEKQLGVEHLEELELLREVKFDRNILDRQEFKSLKENRKDILTRWYSGRNNKEETFEESLARVREIESFIRKRPEKTMILVTHGWFLRLLQIYFVQGNHHTPTIEELLEVEPVQLGQCIKATVAHRPRSVQGSSLGTETTGRGKHYRMTVTSLPNRR